LLAEVDHVGAELGVGEGRHIDVGNGAEDLHRLHWPAISAIEDRFGRAHGDHLVITLHQRDQPAKGCGTVLAGKGAHVAIDFGAAAGIP
jgi:hypothetical protein